MIAYSLRRYSADRIGKFDFALESSGGSLVRSSSTFTHSVHSVSLFGVIPLWHVMSSPKVIIQVRGEGRERKFCEQYSHDPLFSLLCIRATAGPWRDRVVLPLSR